MGVTLREDRIDVGGEGSEQLRKSRAPEKDPAE
ncbi:MAG: hypothetical protein AVDCRST_MAG25-559 [uncultured Rubrobacteraceae bacterium]|uniref:Uncharacterized protein n=1 Tax=uncultured Rubrobacteraceae bacterium TaxID=349277 RepID=A0A6J4R0E5_9ACTN|nr:MAG: hypothetical protein AVDCRST_MAG25-559 [uncultured Rubrobacteraceae bacterium]